MVSVQERLAIVNHLGLSGGVQSRRRQRTFTDDIMESVLAEVGAEKLRKGLSDSDNLFLGQPAIARKTTGNRAL
jgi:hypothetical protein